jgi:hypothetical protein
MSHKIVGVIAILALIGIGVYVYLRYKKVKQIQSPQNQLFDPTQPQNMNTPFNPITYTSVAGMNPFLAGNL